MHAVSTHALVSRLLCVSDRSLLRARGRRDDVELLWRFSVAAAKLSQQPTAHRRARSGPHGPTRLLGAGDGKSSTLPHIHPDMEAPVCAPI